MPVDAPRLAKLLKSRMPDLRKLPEWKETCEILGGTPRTVSVLVCGDEEMRVYNRDYRHLDKTTDVLSFPTREMDLPGVILESEASLGDLILSVPAVERGAQRGRRRTQDEWVEVFLHGILHLLGFDHVTPAVSRVRAARMRAVQAELVAKAGVWPSGGKNPRRQSTKKATGKAARSLKIPGLPPKRK